MEDEVEQPTTLRLRLEFFPPAALVLALDILVIAQIWLLSGTVGTVRIQNKPPLSN